MFFYVADSLLFVDQIDVWNGDSRERAMTRAAKKGAFVELELVDVENALLSAVEAVEGREAPTRDSAFKVLSASQLARMVYRHEWLVKGVLVEGQGSLFGGRQKTLKTSLTCDLAISLATATPFLGVFPVPRRRRMLLLTAESGLPAIQETLGRQAVSRGFDLETIDDLLICDRVPSCDDPESLDEIGRIIKGEGVNVVGYDPLYAMLGSTGANAGNLFVMGNALRRIAATAHENGATPIILHHLRRFAGASDSRGEFAPPELEQLSWAGCSEWARQWLLTGRREACDPGTGEHKLWLVAGGSAGHSGCWGVDVSEGVRDGITDRHWSVVVKRADEVRDELAATASDRENAKEARLQARRDEATVTRRSVAEGKIAAFLYRHPRSSWTSIRDQTGLATTDRQFLAELVECGKVVETKTRIAGRECCVYSFPESDSDEQ